MRAGATLTFQAGTRLLGESAVAGSLLMTTRGARIEARGTADLPIVLTSQRPAARRAPGDRGRLVIAGAAPTALFAALPTGVPTADALDWTPTAVLRTGGPAAFPARVLARTAGSFGGTLPTTTHRGAAAPDGTRWWRGWTAYERD